MHIILAHNYYREPGGEDRVFEEEAKLLQSCGYRVTKFFVRSNVITTHISPLRVFLISIWNNRVYQLVRRLIRKTGTLILHVHNFFPLLSPSIYYAAKAEGVKVVQTLHNYRLICPAATLLYKDNVCERCVGKWIPLNGVFQGCYHNSKLQTMALALWLGLHRLFRTWNGKIDLYIALTEFARSKFIQSGFAQEKIVVKPNFVDPDPGMRKTNSFKYVLYAGRLSPEKGVNHLLEAWRRLQQKIPLKIVGDGPLKEELIKKTREIRNIELIGYVHPSKLYELMEEAAFIVVPSIWYEGMPRIILEAFAKGVAVIASRIGSLEEMIVDGKTGLLVKPGDPLDLALKISWLWSERELLLQMSYQARKEYELKYTAEANFQQLAQIYNHLLESR